MPIVVASRMVWYTARERAIREV